MFILKGKQVNKKKNLGELIKGSGNAYLSGISS
jgi:hypothetical protein